MGTHATIMVTVSPEREKGSCATASTLSRLPVAWYVSSSGEARCGVNRPGYALDASLWNVGLFAHVCVRESL
jgi:hypothetical protein